MKFTRITHDPKIMGGKPCIRGLRVTVGTIVGLLASCHAFEDDDIRQALAYAAGRAEAIEVPLPGHECPSNITTDDPIVAVEEFRGKPSRPIGHTAYAGRHQRGSQSR